MKLKEFLEAFVCTNPNDDEFTIFRDAELGLVPLYDYTGYDNCNNYNSFNISMVPAEYHDAEVKYIGSYCSDTYDVPHVAIVIEYKDVLSRYKELLREREQQLANLNTKYDELESKYKTLSNKYSYFSECDTKVQEYTESECIDHMLDRIRDERDGILRR